MLTTTNTMLLEGLVGPGNEAVWREFTERYRPILIAFARKLGLSDDAARDAAQDTLLRFVKEYRAGNYERNRGRLRSWIFTLARSRVIDHKRRGLREVGWRGESAMESIPDQEDVDAVWDAEWRRSLLRQAMLELRGQTKMEEKTVRAFEMLSLEACSTKEVAEALAMSTNSVYLAKHRALEALRGILTRLEDDF